MRTRWKVVYRIQNEQNVGPFQGNDLDTLRYKLYNGRHDPRDMPSPYDVPPMRRHLQSLEPRPEHMKKPWVFAFLKKGQMYRWFKPALLRELGKEGFHLYVYRVPVREDVVLMDQHQALFHHPSARLVRKEPLTKRQDTSL